MRWWEVTLAALGHAVVMRAVAGHFAYKLAEHYPYQNGVPDEADWFMALLGALVWPATLAACLAWSVLAIAARPLPAVGAERKYHARKRRERHEAELRERERRIRDAERELGIGQ